jgi:hypothetical protein
MLLPKKRFTTNTIPTEFRENGFVVRCGYEWTILQKNRFFPVVGNGHKDVHMYEYTIQVIVSGYIVGSNLETFNEDVIVFRNTDDGIDEEIASFLYTSGKSVANRLFDTMHYEGK